MRNRVRVAFQMSLVCWVFLVVFFLVIYFIEDIGALDMMQDMDFWVPAVFMFIGMKYYRARYNSGELRYWDALAFGGIYTLFVSVLFATFIYVFMTGEGTYLQESITLFQQQQKLLLHKMDSLNLATDPQFEERYNFTKENIAQSAHVTPAVMAIGKAWSFIKWGVVFTVLIGAINRK